MRTRWGDLIRAKLGMTPKEMFSPREAAQIIGVSPTKAWNDVRSGTLSATDLNAGGGKSRCWRITKADIEEYVANVEKRA